MATLSFYKRDVYGRVCAYPMEEEFLEAHLLIARRQTLTSQDLRGYEKLGFKLKEVKDPEPKPQKAKVEAK